MRVFVAVDIDNPRLVYEVSKIRDTLLSTGAPIKPVETENLHITIVFIGEVSDEEARRAGEELKKIRFEPIRVILKGLGAFPNAWSPRVVWIGLSEGSDALAELHTKTLEALRRAGVRYKAEHSSFTPHLTIARVKGRRNLSALAKVIESYREYEFGEMTVEELKLKQSVLTPKGPIYKDLVKIEAFTGEPR